MLSVSHWLLAQTRFCGCTHLPLSPNSTTPTVQVIFQYLWPAAPVFNITTVGMVTFQQSPCWYYPWADVILSTSSDTQHLWTWWHFGGHTGLINLSTTSAVFTPAGHVNILHKKKVLRGNDWINYFREFYLYIDIIVLIMYFFCAKIQFFFKKIIKCQDTQGGITNKKLGINYFFL